MYTLRPHLVPEPRLAGSVLPRLARALAQAQSPTVVLVSAEASLCDYRLVPFLAQARACGAVAIGVIRYLVRARPCRLDFDATFSFAAADGWQQLVEPIVELYGRRDLRRLGSERA